MKMVFSTATKRGVAADRNATGAEFLVERPDSECAWFRSNPDRYSWINGGLVENEDWLSIVSSLEASRARERKKADVENYMISLKSNFHYSIGESGYIFQTPPEDVDNIQKTMIMCLTLPDESPIPTPAPVAGGWACATAEGASVVAQMTVLEFKAFAMALYARNAALWGKKFIHFSAIDQLGTVEQINNYDFSGGWQ